MDRPVVSLFLTEGQIMARAILRNTMSRKNILVALRNGLAIGKWGRAPRGVTLVEMLVMTSILTVMASLLLPAVQMARESGRRVACGNNLQQLALATHGFHAAKESFPAVRWNDQGPGQYWGHFARLLPFLDQNTLFAQIDFHRPVSDPSQAIAAATPLPILLCPSDTNRMTDATDPLALVGLSKINYRGNGGNDTGALGPDGREQNNGIFVAGLRVNLDQLTRGMSNTALLSEALLGDANNNLISSPGDWFALPAGNYGSQDLYAAGQTLTPGTGVTAQYSYAGNSLATGDYTVSRYNHIMPPNTASLVVAGNASDLAAAINSGPQATTVSSRHPGGVNVVMVDGSVRFIRNDVNIVVWQGLGSITGGNPSALGSN